MKIELWAIIALAALWALTIIVVEAKNKELDKLSDKFVEAATLCRALAEAVEKQTATIHELTASEKRYKEAYAESERVRKKLAKGAVDNELDYQM